MFTFPDGAVFHLIVVIIASDTIVALKPLALPSLRHYLANLELKRRISNSLQSVYGIGEVIKFYV